MTAKLFREPSLTRAFGLMSLIALALITAFQVMVQWVLLRNDLLAWEQASTAEAIRREAYATVRQEDFARWQTPDAQERFARFLQTALLNPEILRVKVYGPDMRVVWSDEPRLIGTPFRDNVSLKRAFAGHTVAHIERAAKAENLYERGFARTVELYVPLAFSSGSTPGTARVAGVVEIYKDPSRAFANFFRDRLAIVATSVLAALVLYLALFWLVRRAARQLEAQQAALQHHAAALGRANDELRAMQDQLRASERLAAIGEVSTTVAHGIRNPLASIRASAQVALSSLDDPGRVQKYLRTTVAEADRLGGWLRSLLDTIRPFEPRLAPTDVNVLIEDLLTLLRVRIAEAGIIVERRLAPHLPKIAADEVLLQQAFLVVLENAVEALPAGGTLAVGSQAVDPGEGSWIRVAVRDNGEGIPADRLARVFEPFFTTKSRGTGLGLAIGRRIIEQHGGRVEIASEPGQGTTVTIALSVAGPAVGRAA